MNRFNFTLEKGQLIQFSFNNRLIGCVFNHEKDMTFTVDYINISDVIVYCIFSYFENNRSMYKFYTEEINLEGKDMSAVEFVEFLEKGEGKNE